MSTIDERWNIVDTTRAFCQKVLPLVYDESLSYMELVCKLSSKLNEVIENNNNLPQYVKDLIKETVHSDEFTHIVGSVLMDTIINVKFPPEGITPAKGDGVTDDTSSIQACLDYANSQGGAVVFFPSGKYLTGTLSINTETSILGADRYNTNLVLKGGGNTPLLQGAINQSIRNICLDGNRLNQVEENYLIDGYIDMALFDNVILCDSAHCITADTCNNTEFCNVLCKDIGDGVFITAAGNNNLLTNINTDYAINLTGNNNNWQSPQQTKIASAEPLIYSEPQKITNNFNFVPATDIHGNAYKILVEGDNGIGVESFDAPEDYGAKGDGITDDTDAFIKLFESDKIHTFNSSATYLISPKNIPIKNSVDFNNCTLLINNDSTKNTVFTNEVQTFSKTITGDYITKYRTSDPDLFNKSFLLKSPVCIGKYLVNGNIEYTTQMLVTDESGRFINTPFYPKIISGSYEASFIQDAVVENITVKNCKVQYKNEGFKNRFIHSTRNNFSLENVVVIGTGTSDDGVEVIVISNCYNISINNVIGKSFATATFSYLIGLYNVSDILINKLINYNQNNWHEIGGSRLSNITIKNSLIYGYDSHLENFGYINIHDCTLNAIQIGNGHFDLNVERCIYTSNKPIGHFRRDTPIYFDGSIHFKDCKGNFGYFQMHYVSDSYVDLENLNIVSSNITFENCNNFVKNLISCSDVPYLVNVKAINCAYNNNIINPTLQNINVELVNCKTSYTGVQYFARCKSLIVRDFDFPAGTIGVF